MLFFSGILSERASGVRMMGFLILYVCPHSPARFAMSNGIAAV